ncbi:HD domain-containing protein [Candidatus Pacearchaeota archaeon]|nr:HD domain-containing protein [Candidatus Pacearchaeota archaeon]
MIDYDKLKKDVEDLLRNDFSGHDFKHTIRVYNNVILISDSIPGSDKDVVKISALLHDIAYSTKFFSGEHGDVSAELAEPIVERLELSEKQKETILQSIKIHNFFLHNEKDVPVEVKILRDADRLDALGYMGILRATSYASNAKRNPVEVLKDQLTYENKFETEKGKELSKAKVSVIREFINNLIQELGEN